MPKGGKGWKRGGRGRRGNKIIRPYPGGTFQPRFPFYVVLDFEATCSDNRSEVPPHLQEIIEIPSVLIDARQHPPRAVAEIQVYVRPVAIPQLTKFCTELTGITQQVVEEQGVLFDEGFRLHVEWLRKHGLDPDRPEQKFAIVTCGNWDLKSMLPRQLQMQSRRGSKQCKAPRCYQRWVNIKDACVRLPCTHGRSGRLLHPSNSKFV